MYSSKIFLNFLVIIFLSTCSFIWTTFVFHDELLWYVLAVIIAFRMVASFLLFKDYSLSWSKATPKTFLIKTCVVAVPFIFYSGIFYGHIWISFLFNEALTYLVSISFCMYAYHYYINKSEIKKTKSLVIYGAGKAGSKLLDEFRISKYKIKYFIDDDKAMQKRSIDGVKIISSEKFKALAKSSKFDLLVIAMPSVKKVRINEILKELNSCFKRIKILPSLAKILNVESFSKQLKDISVEELLARNPKDLDKKQIASFIKDKKILITGAGGSIGSEIVRQCIKYEASELILIDNSEFNLYQIGEEISTCKYHLLLQNVVDKKRLDETIKTHKPDIIIHAAAYKHVPLVEENISEAIENNIIGTKNVIDLAIKYEISKFVFISTDKAVRPTNVMGATKRVCELYAQNVSSDKTEIVCVRFGNVLGSSGSVIPKFKSQIQKGENITVTHKDITRYFMLIPEACELVLQAGSLGKGGEIFILDMGEPVKIVDLAQKMIDLSGKEGIGITFTGLRPGEKLYEELLLDESELKTKYNSITIAKNTTCNIDKLNQDIDLLTKSDTKIKILKQIVPEFEH